MKKAVCFTIVDDRYFYPVGAHIFANSFKRFHPDIPLVIFRQDMIDKVFAEKNINFYQAKPTFAKLLTDEYDLVVNMDADTIVTGRLNRVFDEDYDVGGAWNFNDYENASLGNITDEMYIQAGLVGSRNKRFWDIWEEKNKMAMAFKRQENDVLNLVWYEDDEVKKMNKIIYDKDKDYYGCKSLNREPEFNVHSGKLWCRGEEVKAYHWAKGAMFPKLDFNNMDCSQEVRQWLTKIGSYGQTITIK